MAQSKKPDNSANAELDELVKNRQLFLLQSFSKAFKFPTNITNWEEVTCTGYNPTYQRLEAVVKVKQAIGYSGGLCTNGSKEYVRFFVDFKNGEGFLDMGYTSFKVADISDAPAGTQHPLSYTAFLYIDDHKYRKFLDCDLAVIPTMRAVLSWNSIPSANPNQNPHYGNRIDADIQLARKSWIWWKDLVEVTKLKEMAKLIEPEFKIDLKAPVSAQAETIHQINSAAKVPVHRTFYSTIGSRINSTVDFSKATGMLDISAENNYSIDFDNFYEFFNNSQNQGDTTYEELTCVGLNTLTDRLGAIIHIKRASGYIGNLCSKGSQEHVAFWADWNNNGTFDQYLGTVSLNVHDISNITEKGLFYNVELPIDVTKRLRKCDNPNIVGIRAVLSWESLPSTTNPSVPPHWGNHKDTRVQLRPAFKYGSGINADLYYIGGAEREHVDKAPVPHLYYNPAAAITLNNRPWGGNITFHGNIDRNGFTGLIKYRILVKPDASPVTDFRSVSTFERIKMDNQADAAGPYLDDQFADADGWYIYKDNIYTSMHNVDSYLCSWNANTKPDGLYTIRFEHTDEFGNISADTDQFVIMVCNKGMSISPTANTSVDTAYDLDLVIDGGDCHSYTPGDPTINGHLRAVHPYFSSWSIALQPTTHTHGVTPVPVSRIVTSPADNGDANAVWSLDTSSLDPCGYTVSIGAHTRVILNSNMQLPYYAPKAVGFAKLP
ncbi:MAG: hypothetical protein JWO03_2508 [Bacteroidetes bacterium]|nr:hypothetical protein [Bacteroidota bacterium]